MAVSLPRAQVGWLVESEPIGWQAHTARSVAQRPGKQVDRRAGPGVGAGAGVGGRGRAWWARDRMFDGRACGRWEITRELAVLVLRFVACRGVARTHPRSSGLCRGGCAQRRQGRPAMKKLVPACGEIPYPSVAESALRLLALPTSSAVSGAHTGRPTKRPFRDGRGLGLKTPYERTLLSRSCQLRAQQLDGRLVTATAGSRLGFWSGAASP